MASSFFALQKKILSSAKNKWEIGGAFVATDIPFIWLEVWRWVIRLDRTSAHMMKR
jgi:hypothetical protein